MKRSIRYAALSAALLVLSACATFDAKLVTAAKAHSAVTRSVTASLDAELISSEEAKRYQVIAVKSSEILDSARELKDADPSTAQGKLDLANAILIELNKFLTRQLKGQP